MALTKGERGVLVGGALAVIIIVVALRRKKPAASKFCSAKKGWDPAATAEIEALNAMSTYD
jgi:hypothetical protein